MRIGGQSLDLAWWQLYQLLPRVQRALCIFIYSIPCVIIPTILVTLLTVGFTHRRAINFLIVGGVGITGAAIDVMFYRPPPPGRIRLRLPGSGYLFEAVKPSLAFGLVVGTTIGLAVSIAVSVTQGPGMALKSGLASGVIAGLTIVFISMLNGPVDTVRAVSPEIVLSQDREVALVTALLMGADLGVIAGIIAGPWIGLAVSVPGGMTMGLGMSSWGWFSITRIWLGFNGVLPVRLMSFWRDAHRRGILRQTGAVYQFRHARLQKWLARDQAKTDSPGRTS